MTAPVPFQPQQAVHPPSSSSAKTNHSTSTLFQHQPGPAAGPNGHLPTADALFEALAMQNQAPLDAPVTDHPPVSTSAAGGSATSTGAPLSVHVQQLPTPRTSFSSGANSPPENMSPSQSQYTHAHQPHPQHIPHHLSTSQITPTSMISAASSSVSTPSTDYPSTLASPNNTNHSSINNTNINSSEFTNHGAASMTTATATASASWNLSSAMSTSSSVLSTPGTKAPPPSSHLYQPQSYPSLRSASPAMNSSISALGPSLYGSAPPSAAAAAAGVSGPGIGASSTSIGFNQYNGSAVYNNGKNIGGSFTAGTAAGLSQTVSSSYNNNITGSTSISFNAYDSSSDILYQQQQQEALYYDEKEQQKKNARSALSHVTSFLPPAVSHGLSKVVQQAHAAVGSTHGGRKMSLPTIAATAFGGSTTPSSTLGSSTMHVSSAASGVMIRKLYKASKLPLLCLAWYLSSAVTNNIGKQIMNQFRYPVTLTFIQFLFVSLFCFLSGTVGLTKIRTPTVGILQMTAPLVGFQVVGHVFSSVAISRVPLSVVHTIKALSPLFTVVFYRVILGTTYSRAVYISLVPLTAGVMLACRLSLEFNNLVGLCCALASTLVFVTQNVFTKRILFSNKAKQQNSGANAGLGNKDHEVEETTEDIGSSNAQKLDKLNILFYSSTFAAICMVPIWLYAEGMGLMFPDESSGVYHHASGNQAGFWSVSWLLFLNGFSHFFQNVFAFSVLALTSPVTYSIASLIKRIIVIVASIVYFHQTLGATQWTGVCMTFLGLWLYNSAKNAAKVSAPMGIISNTKLGRRVSRNFGGGGFVSERNKGSFLA